MASRSPVAPKEHPALVEFLRLVDLTLSGLFDVRSNGPSVRTTHMRKEFGKYLTCSAIGNGRTGRILNVLPRVEAGLLASPILYLSP